MTRDPRTTSSGEWPVQIGPFNLIIQDDKRLKRFELYLQRHIELDGDIHSHLAKKLVAQICRSEKEWDLAENSALTAIKSRFVNLEKPVTW